MWLALIILAFLLLVGYTTLIENYRRWFLKIKPFDAEGKVVASTRFSVIIPARNEEENIGACLATVLNQQYPSNMFEVIVINDHSTDNTAAIISALQHKHSNLRLLNLEESLKGKPLNSYKKKSDRVSNCPGEW